jgi:gamma-glutamyltranspeptidase/glutathione hydrolase
MISMEFSKMAIYSLQQKPSLARTLRQLVVLMLMFLLTACSSYPLDDLNPFNSTALDEINLFDSTAFDKLNPFKEGENESDRGNVGFVKGFLGGVVVDEPRASIVGREILSSGGSVADVAVGVALTLAVTQPSSASLGGGGVCVIYDNKTNSVETLDFLPGVPNKKKSDANSLTAIPGTIRGLAMLHSRYGRLKWSQLVAPAENLARFGNPVSRAFATDLRKLPLIAWKNPEFRRIFTQGKGGELIQEGDVFSQLDLSATLGRIRVRGAGDFYTGLLGRDFTKAVEQAGGKLSLDDLRNYMPLWRPTLQVPFTNDTTFHFPITSGPSGVLAAQMTKILIKYDNWEKLSSLDRIHLMAEISKSTNFYRAKWQLDDGKLSVPAPSLVSEDVIKRLFSSYQASRHTPIDSGKKTFLPPSPGTGVSFVAVDREGSAISCGLTLNKLFGSGKVANGTGVLLSARSGLKGAGPDSLAGVLLINSVHNIFYFAASASGGPVSPSALVQVTASTLLEGEKGGLQHAIKEKRAHNGFESDLTYIEKGLASNVVEGLTVRGHQLSSEPSLGLVNSIFCSSGIPNDRDGLLCVQRSDPRGFGLSSGSR